MRDRLRMLWDLMAGQRLRYLGGIAALLLAALLLMVRPLLMGQGIDFILSGETARTPGYVRDFVRWFGGRETLAANFWILAALVVLVTCLSGVFTYLKGRWAALASESISRRLRDRLYRHLHHLPSRYHDKADTGDLVQRCSSDVETLRLFLSEQVTEVGRVTFMVLGIAPVLLWLNWQLALVSMVVIPVVLGFAVGFFMVIRRIFREMDESEGAMTTMIQENLTGIRVVRAFARQAFERDKFAGRNAEYRGKWYRVIRTLAVYWSCSDLLCMSQLGAVLGVGAGFIAAGTLSVGEFFAFFTYCNMFIWPVRHPGRVLSEFGKATVSLDRICEILHEPEETDDADAPAPPSVVPHEVHGRVEFENLTFSHAADAAVLHDVSVTVEPGETLALLGPSGSGKSTMINLLLRLYDFEQGSIRLDGVDIRRLPRKFVRAQMGVVLQEPFLFSKSLRENIRLGRGRAGDEEIFAAAEAAHVHDSIASFEQGYDTVVGERGVTLSGGQRQRVAIARALYNRPEVLVFDEATSSLDTKAEMEIKRTIDRFKGNQTLLIVAHRLTTVEDCDTIIWLEKGKLMEIGTPATILPKYRSYSE